MTWTKNATCPIAALLSLANERKMSKMNYKSEILFDLRPWQMFVPKFSWFMDHAAFLQQNPEKMEMS